MGKKNLTIALFGGSFDPPHIGHKTIVEALEKLEYIDEIIIMPTFLSPFKSKSHASSELRFSWLKEIFKGLENIKIDNYEVNQGRAVTTLQSVEYLLKTYRKIYVVIGADNLSSLNSWSNYKELGAKVTFIVASRDNIIIDENFIQLKIDANVSSSELRKKMDVSKLPIERASQIKEFYKDINER